MRRLETVIEKLTRGEPLPAANRDHALTGDYAGARECHIAPDWLLVYKIIAGELIFTLMRTGSHAELGVG